MHPPIEDRAVYEPSQAWRQSVSLLHQLWSAVLLTISRYTILRNGFRDGSAFSMGPDLSSTASTSFEILETSTMPNSLASPEGQRENGATFAARTRPNIPQSDADERVIFSVPPESLPHANGTLMSSQDGRSKYLGRTAGGEWLKDVSQKSFGMRRTGDHCGFSCSFER